MRLALGLIVALVAAAAAPVGAFDDAELRSVVREVGLVPYRSFKPAPDFRYPDVATGRAVGLTELKGRVVLVNVWATWCPPCIKEMPALQGVHEELRDRGFAVIGVNVRDRKNPAAVAAWLGERKLTFVNLKAHDDGPDFPSSFYIPQTFLRPRRPTHRQQAGRLGVAGRRVQGPGRTVARGETMKHMPGQAARLVDKILKGAKPGEVPVPSVLLRADRVIE